MIRKKIVIFTLDITIPGGIERVIANMSNYYFNNSKYDIEIVSIFNKNKEIYYHIPKEVKIVFLSNKEYNLTSFVSKLKSHFCIFTSLFKYKIPCDSILLSTTTNITIYLTLFKLKCQTFQLVAAEHGYYYAFGLFTRIIRVFSYHFVDTVVTLTESEKNIYTNFCKNVVVIPNSLSFFPSNPVDISNKRVISVGRLVREKGFEGLLPIYILLAKKYPDWEFCIFGAGYLDNVLNNMLIDAPSNVKIYPPTKNILDELFKSSIYVCSSETEAFPMVLLEAKACGLSILSFDCPPGPREIINNRVDGLLIEPGNFSSLCNELEIMINDSIIRQYYSNNSRDNVVKYLPNNIFKKWDNLFDLYND